MLLETTMKYYDKKNDLNCAECILVAANEEYDLNISKQTLMTMASFGGGMSIEGICGAATGSLAVIGVMFTNERGHESPIVRALSSEFLRRFDEELETLNCSELKGKFNDTDRRCTTMIKTAASVLGEIIDREINNK